MALSKEVRLAIEAKLRLGGTPKEVSIQLDVKLPTVYAIKQKLDKDKENDLVQELHRMPEAAISAVVTSAREQVLLPSNDIVNEIEAVADGARGLKKLEAAFQATLTNVLRRFDLILNDKETPLKDIKLIADTAANAYEKVFSSGTNIHIGDNNQSNNQLTVFKNKQGV